MAGNWQIVGVAILSSTGRSIRLDLKDMPFTSPYYIAIEDLHEVIAKRKKSATVVRYNTKKTKNETPGA